MHAQAVKIIGSYSLKRLSKKIEANRDNGWQPDGKIDTVLKGTRTYYQQCLKYIP